jgi:hypothetical protein
MARKVELMVISSESRLWWQDAWSFSLMFGPVECSNLEQRKSAAWLHFMVRINVTRIEWIYCNEITVNYELRHRIRKCNSGRAYRFWWRWWYIRPWTYTGLRGEVCFSLSFELWIPGLSCSRRSSHAKLAFKHRVRIRYSIATTIDIPAAKEVLAAMLKTSHNVALQLYLAYIGMLQL